MNNETTGLLKVINDTQRVSDKFQKREFVLTIEGTYPQHVTFQLTQDKVELLANYKVGDKIKVHFNLRGREWNGPEGVKYFNTLEAWRIESIESEPTQPVANNTNDDMPF